MASRTDISNMALAEIAADPIQSPTEETLQARETERVYDQCVREMLELHEWSFARRQVALARIDNDRPHGWQSAFALPADMGTPISIAPADGVGWFQGAHWQPSYEIHDRTLYANLSSVVLQYGVNQVPEDRFSALFTRALVLEIASRILMPLRKDGKAKASMIQLAEIARERAVADDMNRQPERYQASPSPIAAVRDGAAIWAGDLRAIV